MDLNSKELYSGFEINNNNNLNDNKLKLLKTTGEDAIKNYDVRDALEFGPFLIVDGVTQKIPESAGG